MVTHPPSPSQHRGYVQVYALLTDVPRAAFVGISLTDARAINARHRCVLCSVCYAACVCMWVCEVCVCMRAV